MLNLSDSQIVVTDNGAPVKLNGLHLVSGRQQSAPLITLLFDRPPVAVKQNNENLEQLGFAEANPAQTTKQMREAAQTILKSFPGSGFQFAVMDVWGRIQLQQPFGGDRKAVLNGVAAALKPGEPDKAITSSPLEIRVATIAKTGEDEAGATVSAHERVLDRALNAAIDASDRLVRDQHFPTQLACLLALVQSQQALPGRKAIVYFTAGSDASGGANLRDSSAKAAIASIVSAANRAGVSVYMVRASDIAATRDNTTSTLVAFTMMDQDITSQGYTVSPFGLGGGDSEFRMTADQEATSSRDRDALDSLATATGGASMEAGESLSGPTKKLIRNLTIYYEASYVPATDAWDGSFHATAVKPLRTGLKVHTGSGYFALPGNEGMTGPPQPFELPLMALLRKPHLPANLNFTARVVNLGRQDQHSADLAAVEVPVDSLLVHTDDTTHLASAHVSILAHVVDSSGMVIEHFSEDINRRWTVQSANAAMPEAISFVRSFSAPPGNYSLEVAVLDMNSGKGAASRQPFSIAPSHPLPDLSQVLVVRSIEAAAGNAIVDPGPDPLTYGDRRILPNLSGQLAPGASQISLFYLAHIDPTSKAPATVKLEVLHDGTPLGGAALDSALDVSQEFHPVLTSFSIRSGHGGTYQLRATLTQGGKSTVATGEFTLAGDAGNESDAGESELPTLEAPTELSMAAHGAAHPSPEEVDRTLADARENALAYTASLPNFICIQTTSRSQDARGKGDWTHQDSLVERLTYVDHTESRTTLGGEHQNRRADEAFDYGASAMDSEGEFSKDLSGIFQSASKAKFTWKQSSELHGEPVEVFDYSIEQPNSTFSLRARSELAIVGYHGSIYVDRTTHAVRGVTMVTDEAPKDFPIRRSAVRIDYDYVSINDHDYMLPVSAQVLVRQNNRSVDRNDIEFSGFRRFGSTARIVDNLAAGTPGPQ